MRVAIVMRILVIVIIVMRMRAVMMILIEQQPGAHKIDAEAGDRQPGRLLEIDRHRRKEPRHRLVADRRGDQSEDHRARKSRQLAHFDGAEGKARIARMAAREPIASAAIVSAPAWVDMC